MDCEFCAMDGTAGEASTKCSECGEWVCDVHCQFKANGTPLCPSCFEAAEEETPKEDLSEDIEEIG